MGMFQLEVQNNLSKAYKEMKGPNQFWEKEKFKWIVIKLFVAAREY